MAGDVRPNISETVEVRGHIIRAWPSHVPTDAFRTPSRTCGSVLTVMEDVAAGMVEPEP